MISSEKTSYAAYQKYKAELTLINIALLFFIFRGSFPFVKIPFLALYFAGLPYFVFSYRTRFFREVYDLILSLKLIIILFVILVASFLLSDKLYLMVFKDVVNAAILLSFYCVYYLVIDSRNKLYFFVSSLINNIILFGFLVSFFDLLDTLAIITLPDSRYIDYNFNLLPVFFGIFGIIYKLVQNEVTLKKKVIFYFILFLSFTQVFLSGSRRGFVVIIILFLFLILAHLIKYFKNYNGSRSYLKIFSNIPLLPVITLLSVLLFYYFFLFQLPFSAKEKTLDIIGVRNKSMAKSEIAYKISRSLQAVGINIHMDELSKRMWGSNFDPADPESGWGVRRHKIVYPLEGSNAELIPYGTKGYLIDKTSDASTWEGNAYSYTRVWYNSFNIMDSIFASVYCYVSGDFNGTWVNLSCEGNTDGTTLSYYDMDKKDTWQKLSLVQNCQNGAASIYLYLAKYGVTDFSTLNGYVIFAYPEIVFKKFKTDTLSKNEYSPEYHIDNIKLGGSFQKSCASFFSPSTVLIGICAQISSDQDVIRRLASKLISEDTTYHAYKSDLGVATMNNNLTDPRIVRWKFAWQIYTKEYNLRKKLFGGGFNHLNWFGYYFGKQKTMSDFPHNPFFSILLYSGMFGLLIYLIILYKSVRFYTIYFSKVGIFGIFFIICMFFSFFSSGGPFDPPVTGFFLIFPHLINRLHMKFKLNVN